MYSSIYVVFVIALLHCRHSSMTSTDASTSTTTDAPASSTTASASSSNAPTTTDAGSLSSTTTPDGSESSSTTADSGTTMDSGPSTSSGVAGSVGPASGGSGSSATSPTPQSAEPTLEECYNYECSGLLLKDTCLADSVDSPDENTTLPTCLGTYCRIRRTTKDFITTILAGCSANDCESLSTAETSVDPRIQEDCCSTQFCNTEDLLSSVSADSSLSSRSFSLVFVVFMGITAGTIANEKA